jgi:hypothetical protein
MSKLITNYGRYWERSKLFEIKGDNVNKTWKWPASLWDENTKVKFHGIYILYRGMTPVYVGSAMGRHGIFKRLQNHTHDWLAPMWDNVCWYRFDNRKTINVVESLLIASIPGLLNSAEPHAQLGEQCFPEDEDGKETGSGQNTLWMKSG